MSESFVIFWLFCCLLVISVSFIFSLRQGAVTQGLMRAYLFAIICNASAVTLLLADLLSNGRVGELLFG